jgi:hypothetical protein
MTEKFEFPDEIAAKADEKENEIEIEVVDDTPTQDRGRQALDRPVEDPTDEEINSYSDKVKGRIKELTHARHDERRAKESTIREKQELENLAQQLLDENRQLKNYANTGAQQYAATVKQAVGGELETARRNFKAAQEAFDTDAIIAANEALTDAKLRMISAENFKPAPLQTASDNVQIRKSEPVAVTPDDKTLRWQAKNQWFGAAGNEELTSFSLGLHQKLVNSGVDPRSDEYFERIDARMRSTFPESFGGREARSTRPSSVVASATRSSGPKKVQLTTTQIALAKKFGLTPQQYAVQVAILENQNG